MSRPSLHGKRDLRHIPYLPGDEDGLDERSATARRALTDVLDSGLRRTNEAFWTHVERNGNGLAKTLDTYLQFRPRPYEFSGDETNMSSTEAEEDELGKKVFLTLLRLVNDGSRERSRLTADERRRIILKYSLVDVPKIIDLSVLYGRCDRDLVREVIDGGVKLLPTLIDDFIETGVIMEKNLKEMSDRGISATKGGELAPEDLLELLSYFHDVAVSLTSLSVVYPEAGAWLCQKGNLVRALEIIRDDVVTHFENATEDMRSLNLVRESASAAISCLRGEKATPREIQVGTSSEYIGIASSIVSVIESVKMVLPDLGIGFLKACVDHFGPNAELIVQNIFDNSLPQNLSCLDRTLGWPPLNTKSLKRTLPKLGEAIGKGTKQMGFELTADEKRQVLTAAAELEYEDEYDDSFDDLPVKVANTALGIDEIEAGNANVRSTGAVKRTFYILDEKVYHSYKEGAEKIAAESAAEAAAMAAAKAKREKSEIGGLGAGGNKARFSADFVPNAKAAPFAPKPTGAAPAAAEQGPRNVSGAHESAQSRKSGGKATRGLTAKDFAHKHHNQRAKAAKKNMLL